MKKVGTYTLRGKVSESDTEAGNAQRIRLFDGRFDTGYKVIDFKIWPTTFSNSTQPDLIGKLATTDNLETSSVEFMNADDVREIAWAGAAGGTDVWSDMPTIIDPDNFIVEDLFVYIRNAFDASPGGNYMIVLEKYETTDANGALAMVRNNAQNVLGDN
jgi:hypothetical protein